MHTQQVQSDMHNCSCEANAQLNALHNCVDTELVMTAIKRLQLFSQFWSSLLKPLSINIIINFCASDGDLNNQTNYKQIAKFIKFIAFR